MTTPIILPITGNVDPGFLAGLAALSQGLDTAGNASATAGTKAAAADRSWSQNIDTLRRSAQAFNETHQAITTVIGTVTAVVARVGELSDEQARLSAASRRLGLDFDEAASAAGRFVDETEAMGVANRFASADIYLTQQQLNDVMRVAAATADTLGTDTAGAVDILRESLITGRERGLMRFGEEMRRTAGDAHTVEDRFTALHQRALTVTAATDDAASAMARYADQIEDSERTIASALTSELARLDAVATGTTNAAEAAHDWDANLRAIGATMGYVSRLALSGLQIVGGAVGTIVGGITGSISIAAAGLSGLVNTRSLSGAQGAMRAELANVRRDGLAVQGFDLAARGIAEGERLMADQENIRRVAAPDAPPAATPRTRAPAPGGGTGARAANDSADMTFTAEDAAAEEARARITDLEDLAGLAHDRAQQRIDEEINGRLRAEQAANDTVEAQKQAAQDALDIAAQEDAALRTRLEAHEQFAGRLAELNNERVHGAQRAAEFTNSAFDSMGKAIGTHVQALVEGKETVGVALQGMLSDTLISVGKEAVVQGGMEMAKGLAALAGVVTAPLAPGHFAAGAAFLAVGAAAGVAGAALAPSAAAPSSGAGAGGDRAGGMLNDRPSNEGGSNAPIQINYYAPVIGGREATEMELGQRLDRYGDAAGALRRRAA